MDKNVYLRLNKNGVPIPHTKKFMLNRIYYNFMGDKWNALEWRGNAIVSLGEFDTKEEAIEAMKRLIDKKCELGFNLKKHETNK